jgi:putative DNA primase/helicase
MKTNAATDFNDMAAERGPVAVRDAISRAVKPPTPAPQPKPFVDLMCASNIVCVAIRWLWVGFLAKGKFHLIGGAPGTGKTTLAIWIAAVVSIGGRWPDGSRAPAGNVLIWSGEDDPADTLVPRLKAAGADLRRVFFVGDTREGNENRPFDPATDIALLQYEAEQIGQIALIIVDPVVTAVTGDSHKNTEVRRGLQPLVNLGANLDAAILGITHFSKGSSGRDPTERVVGSIAFAALARVVLVTAKMQKEGDENATRLMARTKSNIGPDGGGFAYSLEQIEYEGITASVVQWGEALDGTARELLGEAEAENTADASAQDEATDWLEAELSNGPRTAKDLQNEAKGAGFAWRTVERAKSKLGIKSVKTTAGWQWVRQASAGQHRQGRQESERDGVGGVGGLDPDRTTSDKKSEVIEI